ncbi:aminotransferase class III-fold pyridoxal phosphate-dependent enzyme [Xanthobacter sp. V2C-8]|uniref:aminotransferase class III-fold pyridoxal phosphate-dependent enzyme n=1 Tax=Xanthobacter albus TaxID=3119929 RepID=UPI00372AEC8F
MTLQTPLPEAKANWLVAHNGKHQMHPMQPQWAIPDEPPMIVDRGEDVFIFDHTGRRYIDCQGGLWCVNAGYNRLEIKRAIVDQLDKLQYYNLFPGATNAPSIELSALICEIAGVEGITKVAYGSGGSDSMESALKIARQYWKIEGEPEKIKFISLRNGYHGLHFGAMSACGGNAWRRAYEPLVPGFYQVESPHLYRNPFTRDPEELSAICATLLERELEYQVPDTVAAVIAEPVQGAGGVIVPPASYFPRLREICDRHNVLLIADEVITGFGRSGAMFGSRGWGVKPDIMTVAKGITSGYIPLGATLLNKRVSDAFDRKDSPFSVYMHGYTYSGHPVACAAGVATLKLTLEQKLTENAAEVGAYFLSELKAKLGEFKAVGDIRGKGLMIAVELVKDRTTREPYGPTDAFPAAIQNFCLSHGIMIRCIVNKLIISPPLTFTKAHVDEVVSVLSAAFNAHPS